MSKSAMSGPLIVWGQNPQNGQTPPDYNGDLGPSLVYGGIGLIDPRFGYQNGGPDSNVAVGFLGTTDIPVVDQVPSAISTTAIAALQVPTANTALTLVSTTGAGITVLSSALQLVNGNTIPSGALAIDGASGSVQFGTNLAVNIWDPTKAIARNIQIASVGDDTGATFLVSGYDVYGYPMSERITGVSGATATGKKAFKYVTSVVPAGTLSGSNVSVGQGDTYGFPLRDNRFPYVSIFWNDAYITSKTGWTAADATSPATTTTGDVRGTYTVQSASDGTKRLVIFETPQVSGISSNAGLFGQTQA